jgi:hypothetical protein
MATYSELFQLSLDPTLVQRMTVAVAVAADTIRLEDAATPYHAERVQWAKRALQNPDNMARQCLLCALAQNRTLTQAQVAAATDAALQAAIDDAIQLLV